MIVEKFKITKCPLEGLIIIEPTDENNDGYYMETYNKDVFEKLGLNIRFVQENQSMSKKGVLRGVHLQKNHPQGKLIRVIKGKVFDVAVDLRSESSTYKNWYGIELSETNKKQFYIPEGFAHGFLALTDDVGLCFKVTDYFYPGDELGFVWNDPEIGIEWPNIVKTYDEFGNFDKYCFNDGTEIVLGEKDKHLPCLSDALRIS